MEKKPTYNELEKRVNALETEHRSQSTLINQTDLVLKTKTDKLTNTEKIAHIGSWEWDLQTNDVKWSDELYRILGHTPNEFPPDYQRWLEQIHPEDTPVSDKFALEIMNGNGEVSGEYRIIRKDNTIRHVSVKGQSLLDDQNNPVKAFGIVQDITHRKQTQQALQMERDNFRNILETMNDLVYIVDGHYNIRYGNPILKEKFGPKLDKKCYVYFHDRTTPCDWCKNDNVFSGESVHWKCQFTRDDRTYDLMGTPIRNSDGSVHILEIVRDITHHKQAEEEKLALERQVLQAQKLESLGVLAGGIAHDFNNLLMAILGNADLGLMKLPSDSPLRANFQEIVTASSRAAELAKQMLAYSGKGQFVIETVDGNQLLKDMNHLLEVLSTKQTEIKYDFAENLPTFEGDVTQIRQVIMNLVSNAVEAIGDTNGIITISTGAMECDRAYLNTVNQVWGTGLCEPPAQGNYVYISITDTGCGMSKETIPKIFDPFFTTKFTGRGLGLSAVLGIMRGHKGTLNVYSEINQGTAIKALFPVSDHSSAAVHVAPSGATSPKEWTGSGTVLLVDDEETVLEVGREMLACFGFDVATAPDGYEALEIFRAQPRHFTCVLMDLTMPRMDGEEAFREMKRIYPDVTVILCSGYNEQDATRNFCGKGLAGFIQKPFNMSTLKEKLMEVLDKE